MCKYLYDFFFQISKDVIKNIHDTVKWVDNNDTPLKEITNTLYDVALCFLNWKQIQRVTCSTKNNYPPKQKIAARKPGNSFVGCIRSTFFVHIHC